MENSEKYLFVPGGKMIRFQAAVNQCPWNKLNAERDQDDLLKSGKNITNFLGAGNIGEGKLVFKGGNTFEKIAEIAGKG